MYTWYNKREYGPAIFERLDRFLTTKLGLVYNDAMVEHRQIVSLECGHILLCTAQNEKKKQRNLLFKLEVKWFLQDSFYNLIKDN